MGAAVDDDPQVAAGAERTAAARVRDQPLRVSDDGAPVGSAGIEASDERTRHDHRQLAAAVVPGSRPARETWLDVTTA